LVTETHLFIIWEYARNRTNELFSEIRKKFKIHDVYEITWSPNNFSKNLKRFYGVTLPDPKKKAKECGMGPFLLVIVSDSNPKHGVRRTSMGKQIVNTNIYDSKRKYRILLGADYRIHGSIHKKEANHDLTLLLGKNLEQITQNLPEQWDDKIKSIKSDIIGTNGWKNLEELFFVLNNTINYVALRNFEKFPDISNIANGGDIDLLTDELWQIPHILNFEKQTDDGITRFCHTKIASEYIKFDIRYVGDSYFDEKWSKEILDKKVQTQTGFYSPNNENYFYSLLYHIIVQKARLSKKYEETLTKLAIELGFEEFSIEENYLKRILNDFMKEKGYQYTNSLTYRINHNELTRLTSVAIHTAKNEGLNELLRAIKEKTKRIIKK